MIEFSSSSFTGMEDDGLISATVVISNNLLAASDITVTCTATVLGTNPPNFPTENLAASGTLSY